MDDLGLLFLVIAALGLLLLVGGLIGDSWDARERRDARRRNRP